jgi:hypothetical protein
MPHKLVKPNPMTNVLANQNHYRKKWSPNPAVFFRARALYATEFTAGFDFLGTVTGLAVFSVH